LPTVSVSSNGVAPAFFDRSSGMHVNVIVPLMRGAVASARSASCA
jgi:hypothetical protein